MRAFVFLLLGLCSVAHAELRTDRPGNGNAATTVDRFALQLETSALVSAEGALVLPTAARFGVTDFVELRLSSTLINPTLVPGFKLRLNNDGPALALSVDVSLPTSEADFERGLVVPDVRLLGQWSLPAGFAFLGNVGLDVPADDELGRITRGIFVVNFGYTLPVLDGRVSLFGETFGQIPLGVERTPVLQLDFGASWMFVDDWQFDFFTQHALTDASSVFQIAMGLSTIL